MSSDHGNGGGQASGGAAQIDPAHLPEGYVVGGKYQIKRLLGEGANGSVYEGEHSEIGHRVAIKVVHKTLAAREDIIARFRREARICGTIRNRHVGQVYDVGELPGGAPYMVMELQDGHSLGKQLASEGPMPIATAVDIVSQLLIGLQAAHDTGAIHRDVKPDNVMLVRESSGQTVVKLVDFGIGKSVAADIKARNVTQEGMVVGSPDYMPPEQLRGEAVDHRVDIYAAGVVLYELITGRMPFNATSLTELFVAILRDPIEPVLKSRSDCPTELEAIILKAMSREAADRYQSANEMRQALIDLQRTHRLSSGSLLQTKLSTRPAGAQQSQTRRASGAMDYALETERVRTAELQVPIKRAGSRMLMIGAVVAIAGVGVVWAMRSASGGEHAVQPQAAASVATPAPAERPAAAPAPATAEPAAPRAAAPEPPPSAAVPSGVVEPAAEPAAVTTPEPAVAAHADTRPKKGAAGTKAAQHGASATVAPPPAAAAPKAEPPKPAAQPAAPVGDLIKQAAAAFVRGQMPLARSLYRDATEHAPSNADAWRGLGMVSSRMGEKTEASRAFKRYLQLRPDAPDAEAIKKKLAEL
jgi:serine/threonine-protein kinase